MRRFRIFRDGNEISVTLETDKFVEGLISRYSKMEGYEARVYVQVMAEEVSGLTIHLISSLEEKNEECNNEPS